jgi:hypothetical protein
MSQIKTQRLPFLILAFVSLVVGIIAGLGRIGWTQIGFPSMIHHGGIMIGGFLGTLISLEKIIPLKKKFLYVFPVLSGSSIIAFLLGQPESAFILLMAASIGLTAVFLIYLLRERSLIYALMALGSLSWLVGNILMLYENFYPLAIAWWMGFTLLIISAERLELMKFLPVTNSWKHFFTSLLLLFLVSSMFSFHGTGALVSGVSLIASALWLLKFDLIGITIKKTGLTKFIAVALLSGYVSLLLSGVFTTSLSGNAFGYDITLHTFFIGFVFSMIFAHGPIILPGVIGSNVKPYHRIFYLWLILLHFSWLLRAIGGVTLEMEWRRLSGIISLISILGYLLSLAVLTTRSITATATKRKNINSIA